jgi:hypothetical protein
MDDCNIIKNINPCDILDQFIKIKNGKVGYAECHMFLNNNTNLTQIEINQCLNKRFPDALNHIQNKWVGII